MTRGLWIGVVSVWTACAAGEGVSGAHATGPMRLILPPIIESVVGLESNVYLDNVVREIDPYRFSFDVDSPKGRHQSERWTFTPGAADAGAHPLTIAVRDEANEVVAEAKAELRVNPVPAGAAASLLCIGDSLTAASVYTQHLLDLAQESGVDLRLVGTNGPNYVPGENRHEGYSGWTARHFATHYTGKARGGEYAERGSPFLYPDAQGQPAIDFKRYCEEVNDGRAPDFVTIFLGCNDVFLCNDADIDAVIDEMLGHLDALIASIHAFDPTVRIGLLPPPPPAASQDAFGAAYGSGQTRRQYRRNQHRTVERLHAHYDGRAAEGLSVVPVYLNLDSVHNYPTATAPWNARTDEEGARQADSVHPAVSGYRQIGDTVWAWLVGRMGEEAPSPEGTP